MYNECIIIDCGIYNGLEILYNGLGILYNGLRIRNNP